MRIVRVHNYYQQPGGEDQSYAAEIRLLQAYGHEVIPVTLHNDQIETMGRWQIATTTIWNQTFYQKLQALVQRVQPAVVHFDNTFPLVSPAAYYAVRRAGVPVVQSLRNYRLLCANAYFLRDGRVCEDCLHQIMPWPAIAHACYRESLLASLGVAALQSSHRILGTWQHQVDCFVALTPFVRQKFIEGGLPAAKIAVKPNFLAHDPGYTPDHREHNPGYALFVGRLSPEKGLVPLLEAWRSLGDRLPLRVVGTGPLADQLSRESEQYPHIHWLGSRSQAEVLELMRQARLLVMPSLWYETFGRVIIEAFAVGLPVLASRLGSMEQLIQHQRTGLLVQPGDPQDLVATVNWALAHPAAMASMRRNARTEYEALYTPERNYALLMAIYAQAHATFLASRA
ncbi:MAG: glycosyltransferase family 4 protein [Oscillochloridaceae bacterium umkhey_bin13]